MINNVQICPADAAGFDLNLDLIGRRLGRFDL